MIFGLLLLAATADPFPVQTGQCRWVRGRFAVHNGSSLSRLSVAGTRHILALRDGDEYVPLAIKRYWAAGPHNRRLVGYFHVCAREPYVAGHLQHIRIVATRRTRLQS